MASRDVLPFPCPVQSQSVHAQAVRERCWPAREQSWALRALSGYHRRDIARLLKRSDALLARSRRLRIKLLP
jgi:hypothetical protein